MRILFNRWIIPFLKSVSKGLSIILILGAVVVFLGWLALRQGLITANFLTALFVAVSIILLGFIVLAVSKLLYRMDVEYRRAQDALEVAYIKLKNTQAQLVQAAKMAAVGQLASGVAHEINNPLTGVLNNVQLIKTQIEQKARFAPDEFKEILDVVEESALRCRKIIRSLLDFSRTSRGPFHFFSLNETIEKVLTLIEHELKSEHITIETNFQADLPDILGDNQLLQQVIFDIISNARWAIMQARKDGGKITIKTEYAPQARIAIVSISDTGIGIPKENLDKIFEPFFTTKPVGQGTGLGLSIVYGIIKEHKGEISVESEKNKGTNFKIMLPVH